MSSAPARDRAAKRAGRRAERQSADPPLGDRDVAALRRTRAALVDVARTGDLDAIAPAVAAYVRAMVAARFTNATIPSLVHAAVDRGLPTVRRRVDRVRRAEVLAAASDHGRALVATRSRME